MKALTFFIEKFKISMNIFLLHQFFDEIFQNTIKVLIMQKCPLHEAIARSSIGPRRDRAVRQVIFSFGRTSLPSCNAYDSAVVKIRDHGRTTIKGTIAL